MIAVEKRCSDLRQDADGPKGAQRLSPFRGFSQRRTVAGICDEPLKEILRQQWRIAGTDRERSCALITRPLQTHLDARERSERVAGRVIEQRQSRSAREPFRLGSRTDVRGDCMAAAL